MNTLRFSRVRIIGLIAAIGLLLSTTVSFAQTEELQASVVITGAALSITPGGSLALAVNGPTAGVTNFQIDPVIGGGCSVLTGTGSCNGSGTNAQGDFTVDGGAGAAVELSSNITSCTAAPVTMSNITYSIDGAPSASGATVPMNIQVAPNNGVTWGADFAITSAAVSTTCTVDVTVAFQ